VFLELLLTNNKKNESMKKINIYALLFICIGLFTSCDEDGYEDFTVPQSSVAQLSADWWVIPYDPAGDPAFGASFHTLTTSNTAADNGQMQINDHGNWMEIQTVVSTNPAGLSFSGDANALEMITGGTVTVSNGQVVKGGGTSLSGRTTDSITFDAEFDWMPGVIFTYRGHKKTGFLEDEY